MKVGERLTIKEKIKESSYGQFTTKETEYEIKGIYPHVILLAQVETGLRRCLNFGEMITMGIVRQPPWMEAERELAERMNKYPPGRSR